MLNKILAALIIFTWFFGLGAAVFLSADSWLLSIAVVVCGLVIDIAIVHHANKLDAILRSDSSNSLKKQQSDMLELRKSLLELNQRVLLIESHEVEKH